MQEADPRRVMIILGVVGIVAILLLVAVGLYISPPTVDEENQVDTPKAAPAPKPPKKPALD